MFTLCLNETKINNASNDFNLTPHTTVFQKSLSKMCHHLRNVFLLTGTSLNLSFKTSKVVRNNKSMRGIYM